MKRLLLILTTVLALTLLFCLMVWGLLIVTGRTVGMRPEDRKDGEIVENAGALGFFPPSSIVPFWSTVAITAMLLGAVYGWWISLLGVGLGIWAACGVALTAILSKLLFDEPFSWIMAAGIALVVGGVLLVELGAAH